MNRPNLRLAAGNGQWPALTPVRLLAFAAWLAAVFVGESALWRYATTAATPAQAVPSHWPLNEHYFPDPGVSTVLLFGHPQCPCTRATLAELARLLGSPSQLSQPRVWVFFHQPSDQGPEWAATALWRAATEIPGARVRPDLDGQLALRFGVEASGHTLLYGPDGDLRFSGGITAARGHEGDNPGLRALAGLLTGADDARPGLSLRVTGPRSGPHVLRTPVFGCPLREAHDPFSSTKRRDKGTPGG